MEGLPHSVLSSTTLLSNLNNCSGLTAVYNAGHLYTPENDNPVHPGQLYTPENDNKVYQNLKCKLTPLYIASDHSLRHLYVCLYVTVRIDI